MIDIEKEEIVFGAGRREKIINWTIAFKSPFGIYPSLKEAVEHVKSIDLNPVLTVSPVAVAHSATMTEVYS